jgi:hypothetical protein
LKAARAFHGAGPAVTDDEVIVCGQMIDFVPPVRPAAGRAPAWW